MEMDYQNLERPAHSLRGCIANVIFPARNQTRNSALRMTSFFHISTICVVLHMYTYIFMFVVCVVTLNIHLIICICIDVFACGDGDGASSSYFTRITRVTRNDDRVMCVLSERLFKIIRITANRIYKKQTLIMTEL